MPCFWHSTRSKKGNNDAGKMSDQVMKVKSLRRVLNDLEIKMMALENKIYYSFFSIEDILNDMHGLKSNQVVNNHSVILEVIDLLVVTVKKIFQVDESYVDEGLRLASNAVEMMDNFIYGYYYDGTDDSKSLQSVKGLLVEWLEKVDNNAANNEADHACSK